MPVEHYLKDFNPVSERIRVHMMDAALPSSRDQTQMFSESHPIPAVIALANLEASSGLARIPEGSTAFETTPLMMR
jgi:hypothetical protein